MRSTKEISARTARLDQPGQSWLDILFAQPQLRVVLLQDNDPSEPHVRLSQALRRDGVALAQLSSSPSRVHEHGDRLRAGMCLPVGSRDFVRACMRVAGLDEPRWSCYPKALLPHMLGQPRRVKPSEALQCDRPVFVKPVLGSPFDPFMLREKSTEMSSWEAAQLDRLRQMSSSDRVWVSRQLPVAAEWRYYVLNGEVIGYAPAGPVGRARAPCIEEVSSIIAGAPVKGAFALDFAVLEDGTTTLLCARDAWGLDWYPFASTAPGPMAFLQFLWTRWCDIHLAPRELAANSPSLRAEGD